MTAPSPQSSNRLRWLWASALTATIVFASGIFLLAVVPAVAFLMRSGYEQGRRSFPYTLAVDATLTGTYSEAGYKTGDNVVTVVTEVDTYSDTKPIVWGLRFSPITFMFSR